MSQTYQPVDLGRCADALDELGDDIERLGQRLCADPRVMAGHLAELQDIDRIAQFQRALAQLLRADLCSSQLHLSGLDELIERLGHARG